MQTPSTIQIRTAIEVLKKYGEHLNHHASNLAVELAESPQAIHDAGRITAGTIEQTTRIRDRHRAVGAVARRIDAAEEAMCFKSYLRSGQALLLSKLRFSWPRIGRGGGAERLRNRHCSWPQTRPGHGHDPAQCRPRTQTVRVREQSASADCPRPQSRSQTVRVHGLATDSIVHEQAMATVVDCPQTVRSRGLSTTANWPRPRFVRSRRPAKNCPRPGIASSTSLSASFPVHIQPIPIYDHV